MRGCEASCCVASLPPCSMLGAESTCLGNLGASVFAVTELISCSLHVHLWETIRSKSGCDPLQELVCLLWYGQRQILGTFVIWLAWFLHFATLKDLRTIQDHLGAQEARPPHPD